MLWWECQQTRDEVERWCAEAQQTCRVKIYILTMQGEKS